MAGSQVEVVTPDGTVELNLPLPGLYNVYNALAALAAARQLGIDPAEAAAGIAATQAAFGRVETIDVGGVPVSILLIKNPAGANEVLRTLRLEAEREGGPARLDLWLALNDRIADGRDVSWIWDADLELLAETAGRAVCAGTRAAEMAVRLKYAGIDPERIEVRERIDDSLDLAVAGARGRVYALPTYTALIELRQLLARRGLAAEYWR
jgi:UDP-N-acetylmuramyl tripeptide synthase